MSSLPFSGVLKSISTPGEIRIKDIPDESHNIIELHEIKEKSSSSIILEVLPRPSDCGNIVIFGDEISAKVENNNDSVMWKREFIGKNHDLKTPRGDLSLQCFHCGFDCKIVSHMKEHYNILRLSKPFESCEIGFECKPDFLFSKSVDSSRGTFSCPACQFGSIDEETLKEHISECHTKKAPFVCSDCKLICKTQQSLANHLLGHASEKTFKCLHCAFSCKLHKYLRSHIKFVHSKDKPFVCSKCPFKSKRKIDIAKHENKHNAEKPFHCKTCDFKSKSRHYLKKHMLIHKGTLPFHCSVCDYRCVTKYILKDHYINHHTHEKPFKCSLCGLCFKRNTTLKRHMITHTEAKPFQCHLCEYSCSRKDNLKSHITVSHTDLKPFKCTECNFSCKLKTALKLHSRVHCPDRPFVCERCNYRFKSESKLRRHAVLHSLECRFICPHCPHHCKTKTDLKLHIHFSHTVKDLLCCSYCDFVSKNEVVLEKHIKSHGVSEDSLFKCSLCDAKFSHKIQLKNHHFSHSSVDPILHKKTSQEMDIKLQPHDYPASDLALCENAFKHNHINIHIHSVVSENPLIKIEPEKGMSEPLLKTKLSELKILSFGQESNKTEANNINIEAHSDYDRVELKDPEESPQKRELTSMEGIKFGSDQKPNGLEAKAPAVCIISEAPPNSAATPLRSYSADYECQNCSFSCSKKTELKHHTKIHEFNSGYKCPQCEEMCQTKAQLKHHLTTDHKDYKPFRCDHCGQGFRLKSNLKQHSVVHSGNKPYHCALCDYRAKLRETLRRHYVTHSTEKPFRCSVCAYSCKLKEKLKRHLITHSSNRPFHCPECDYTCKTKELLKKHSIVHTRDVQCANLKC